VKSDRVELVVSEDVVEGEEEVGEDFTNSKLLELIGSTQ